MCTFLIHWREVMPFRGNLKDLKGRPVRNLWSSVKVLHPGQGNPKHNTGWAESGWQLLWGKDLGVLVGEKLNITWQRTLIAQNHIHILGCAKRFVISRSREEIVTFCSALVRPRLECSVQVWGPQIRTWNCWRGFRGRWSWSKGWRTSSVWKGLEMWGCSVWRGLRYYIWGHLMAIFQYLKGTSRKVGEGLFQRQVVMGQGGMALTERF